MRFLRALLNSGVFMIILLAAATLYLVYSDAIKREHGIDVANETAVPAAETPAPAPVAVQEAPVAESSSAPVAVQEVPATVAVESAPVAVQEPIQAEPAFETQPPAQVQSNMGSMMPYQGMMPMPEQVPMAMPMPMPEPMMAYQPAMDMPHQMQPMMQQEAPMPPVYQQAPNLPQSNVERARAALYEGNLEVAQQAYQAELSAVNDPDLHGELGNVYFAQQNWQAAAAEYAAAVDGLSAQGRFLQAQYVLGFLMQIDPDMGQKAMTNLRANMYPQTN
jgi:tetratricopeptide (TPR) repeat protein